MIKIELEYTNYINNIKENGCFTSERKTTQTIICGMHRDVNRLSDVKIGYSLHRNRRMYEYGERVTGVTYIL